MATSTIKQGTPITPITVTVDSTKIGFASWGGATGYRVGRIVFIRFHGFQIKSSITSSTVIATFSGDPAVVSVVEPIHLGSSTMNGVCSIDANSNNINMNTVTDTHYSYCQLVFPV